MKRTSLLFNSPRQVDFLEEHLPDPAPHQALVKTLHSAISPGTEIMIYRGQFPRNIAIDEHIPALSNHFAYPLKYGYSVIGQVVALGKEVDPEWMDKTVFAFQPHESHFLTTPEALIRVPHLVSLDDALFLPNMETAVNLIMDGAPLIGEFVVIFGQGIVGLLATALLAEFPLKDLITLDRYELRRHQSISLGATQSLDPDLFSTLTLGEGELSSLSDGADLIFELSGNPDALDQALQLAGFATRIVVGSWYGQKKVALDLGAGFHRNRISLISSQVSTLAPHLRGRWSKERRFETVWEMIHRVKPARFITHRFQFSEAPAAYQLIDQHPGDSIQVVFDYS